MPRSSSLTVFHKLISGLRLKTPAPQLVSVLFFVSILSFILLGLPVSSGAELSPGWASWRYPNPRNNPEECGWTDVVQWAGDSIRNISWICDPDRVLGYHEAYNLALLLDRYHREAQCDCPQNCSHGGYQIAVALVDRLNTDGPFEPMKVIAKTFAQDVRVSWFSDDGCDDNVLIFYSVYDDELYISIGETTKIVISDIELVRLNDIGDRYLTGKSPSTPPPKAGALHINNSSTVAPPSTAFIGPRRSPTYDGLESLVNEVHVAIVNGRSVSASLVYGAVVPVLLVLMILTMCLLANWCCRPVYGYHQPAPRTSKKKDDSEEA